ncbi:MAG: phosphoenolpyruvate synthase [Thalassotalea sp.]
MQKQYVEWLSNLGLGDLDKVGGKNASLGEMISNLTNSGVRVPTGFATTALAFNEFITHNNLDEKIATELAKYDESNVSSLSKVGETIRNWILASPFQDELQAQIETYYEKTVAELGTEATFAVRSSATAEDMPDASFAGQQETYLNVSGIEGVLLAIKNVFASLFNDRAISYRVHQGYHEIDLSISAGVQQMVRSDKGASGVMFTIDTESGFEDVVFINSAYGLGEMVVQGAVNPDEFYVFKPSLNKGLKSILRKNIGLKASQMVFTADTELGKQVEIIDVPEAQRQQFSLNDDEIQELAKLALIIEAHYKRPMDIEWAKDGIDGQLYIVQARPETVRSRESKQVIETYKLHESGKVLCEGRATGSKIGVGVARVVSSIAEMDLIQEGDVIVTDMTDPDWEPVMKKASALVTNKGGRTCHAAIIARELGIPAVVGCGNATDTIKEGETITVSCAEGDTGIIYQGALKFEVVTTKVDSVPELPTKLMMNVANPDRAFGFSKLPNQGVGLARLEFIIANSIGIHPKAIFNFDQQSEDVKAAIMARTAGYSTPREFYVEKLKEGIATIAAAFYPKKVIVRLSDFKSNEYSHLIGGPQYEPNEENPMIGYRGVSRYLSESFHECFVLECEAMKQVRNELGLTNVEIMIPFVRTLGEGQEVIELLKQQGLRQGENGLRVIMMCEIPSNAILADQFLDIFDGFSIGSNDLTQLTLGLDRDSDLIAHLFDERNEAVKALIAMAIKAAKAKGKYIGICGQGPSDHPELAEWLLKQGIDSMSLNPDSVVEAAINLSKVELTGENAAKTA